MLEKDLEIKDTDKQRRKLVDYFNQWREEKFWEKWHFTYTMRFDHAHIISKKFWFIQRLVENDKIEKYKVIELEHNWIRPFKLDNLYWEIKLEERLLMLLSIQDNPIEFLCSVLK